MPLDASNLGGERSGQWSALPSEDWYVLERDDMDSTAAERACGRRRLVARLTTQLAETLLTRFYPTTELNDLSKNRLDERSLKLTAIAVEADRVRARIDGRLKMKHPFYPGRDDDNFVNATIVGLIEFDPSEAADPLAANRHRSHSLRRKPRGFAPFRRRRADQCAAMTGTVPTRTATILTATVNSSLIR